MRAAIVFAVLGFATATDLTSYQVADCMVDGAEAVDDAADGALFIWAAYKRCGRQNLEVKCTVDVASAVESVNSMINIMLKAMQKCGHLNAANAGCGMAAGVLTKSVAGLTAASADIIQKCANTTALNQTAGPSFAHVKALCLVDIKDSAKAIMKLTKEFMQVSKNCAKEDKHACTANAFRIIGGFAAIGEFVSGSIGHCSKVPQHHKDALCAQAVSMLTHHTAKVAAASTDLSAKCRASAPAPAPMPIDLNGGTVVIQEQTRLYEQSSKSRITTGSANFVLGAFLPVTAIVAFAGGSFFANRRIQREQSRSLVAATE